MSLLHVPPVILSVEDNPADIRLISELVKLCDGTCSVHFVRDGESALDYLHRTGKFYAAPRPNLILLDLNIPKKDGREVLQEIKTDPQLCGIPVVIFSSSTRDDDIVQSYERHASCYVVKPLSLDEYEAVLRKIHQFWLRTVELPLSETRRVS